MIVLLIIAALEAFLGLVGVACFLHGAANGLPCAVQGFGVAAVLVWQAFRYGRDQ